MTSSLQLDRRDQGVSKTEDPRTSPTVDASEAAPVASNPCFVNRDGLPPAGQALLDELLGLQLLTPSVVREFLDQRTDRLAQYAAAEALGQALVQAGLLTSYQMDRVLTGNTYGLTLGNYRVRERVGAGGMGVVFLAEHYLLKRPVAVKVLPVDVDCSPAVRQRFYSEMRVLADLHHPNIVLAFDAGELPAPVPDMPALIYLVMELVSGGDLEQYVLDHGPRPVAQACDWIRQAACGLQEAHDQHLIHRDVKPSNLLLTPRGQVKVVDFGLVRQFCSRLTDPRALLGSIEFMAPEQSYDPSIVSAPADIYGLGATLFWLLTGEPPYPICRSLRKGVHALQHEPPRRLRALRPDAPAELEAFLDRMLDRNPLRRPALPLAVMNALAPFALAPGNATALQPSRRAETASSGATATEKTGKDRRVLIVDDEESLRLLSRLLLTRLGYTCTEAADGATALTEASKENYDLILLDLNLPDIDGYEVCRRLRERPPSPHLKVIVVSGQGDQNALAESLPRGADDYVPKPFELRQLEVKVQHALQLKDAQERVDLLTHHLQLTNRQLEKSLDARVADVRQAHNALLFAMAKMAESRDGETPGHLRRLQLYARCLAEQAALAPPWAGLVDTAFLEQLERCVPLHDIGKIGLPDHVLLKPGKLDAAERALVMTHPVIGDRILEALGREHGEALEFMNMATAIVRHHHERYDGTGYPDRLSGDAIPAAARLVALADVYDALRRERLYKPALPHAEAVRQIQRESPGQFDPTLLEAFAACHGEFERIYRDVTE